MSWGRKEFVTLINLKVMSKTESSEHRGNAVVTLHYYDEHRVMISKVLRLSPFLPTIVIPGDGGTFSPLHRLRL